MRTMGTGIAGGRTLLHIVLAAAAGAVVVGCRTESSKQEDAAIKTDLDKLRRQVDQREQELQRALKAANEAKRRVDEVKKKMPRRRIIHTNAFPLATDGGLRQLCECDRDDNCVCY